MNQNKNFWEKSILANNLKVKDAISNLNNTSLKIVIVVDENENFFGTITDGDIRRALLQGFNLDSPLLEVTNKNPIYASMSLGKKDVLVLMKSNKINQVPIIDTNRNIVGLHLAENLDSSINFSNKIVIMAGGKGKRLYPITKNIPKPLVRVAGKPMIEHIIERAKIEGFNNFIISINYLGHMIQDYFENGDKLNVSIEYIKEDTPLGTAGALSLIKSIPKEPIIVTNGDVFTDIRFSEILNFHNNHDAEGTMAVKLHESQNPYGVVNIKGIEIIDLQEKPIIKNYINAGVYVLEPLVLNFLLRNNYCDMPLLFKKIKENNKKIIAFPMHEPWTDVGKMDDLKKLTKE